MSYVGMDLHKAFTQYAVVNGDGVILDEGRIENEDPSELEKFSDSLAANTNIVIESSSTWYWVYKMLSKRHHVILSNPAKTKAIASAKVKTDRIDSITLANLLRGGYIAESYIPPARIMEFRELVRYRANLVRQRAQLKNRVHASLLMNNIRIDAKPFTEKFVAELRKVDDYRVQGCLRLIESVNRELKEVEKLIAQKAGESEDAKLLMTIPGISYYSALLISSEIGAIDRFPDSSGLVAYAGLSPSTHSSGGKTYHGPITKRGSPYLRWVLNQCTRSHIKTEPDGTVALFYDRLARKKGDQKAIVAASAKLLKIAFWVLKERREYHS
ncbi:MAG: IS110 family transposase [Nitrososphaerota archaeon]|nr:IS110 family transposase [Nitrososphaerota archaeon]